MDTALETVPLAAPSLSEGWQAHVFDTIASTNPVAGVLPAWTAVRASTQTRGRGRTTDRQWVSDEGGLWLSAVLPCPGPRAQWEILPLAAGWAIIRALRKAGVPDLRLRWPNDIMHGRRKLAGLLVERYRPDTAVIGVGLNVQNQPELTNPALREQTARLADLLPGPCTVDDAAQIVLAALRTMHGQLLTTGFGPIAAELNHLWLKPRQVAVTLTGHLNSFDGLFQGIDPTGRLRIVTPQEGLRAYAASEVTLLRELE